MAAVSLAGCVQVQFSNLLHCDSHPCILQHFHLTLTSIQTADCHYFDHPSVAIQYGLCHIRWLLCGIHHPTEIPAAWSCVGLYTPAAAPDHKSFYSITSQWKYFKHWQVTDKWVRITLSSGNKKIFTSWAAEGKALAAGNARGSFLPTSHWWNFCGVLGPVVLNKDMHLVDWVQKNATNTMKGFEHLSNKERLSIALHEVFFLIQITAFQQPQDI